MYRVVQKKGTVLLSTSLAWPAVAGCSRAETFSQLSSISFAQPCSRNFSGIKSPISSNFSPIFNCLQFEHFSLYLASAHHGQEGQGGEGEGPGAVRRRQPQHAQLLGI